MSKYERSKGQRGERDVAKLYRCLGGKYQHARRHAENTYIDSGYDLDGCGADFPEVKNRDKPVSKQFVNWLDKVIAATLPHGHWCLWQKVNLATGRRWTVTISGERYIELLKIEQEAP